LRNNENAGEGIGGRQGSNEAVIKSAVKNVCRFGSRPDFNVNPKKRARYFFQRFGSPLKEPKETNDKDMFTFGRVGRKNC
jgi:hypothetical protein